MIEVLAPYAMGLRLYGYDTYHVLLYTKYTLKKGPLLQSLDIGLITLSYELVGRQEIIANAFIKTYLSWHDLFHPVMHLNK